jgi:4-amino-4-deoxy-L-arabinose transferase-like glycosyltransferase
MENGTVVRRTSEGPEKAFNLYRPEKSATDWVLALLLGAFAVYWVRPLFTYIGLGSDEGIVLQGAVRILRGEVPYRDFFSFYTPGSYYLHALIFRLFGTSVQTARSLLFVYAALFPFLTYMLSRRVNSRRASLVAALLLSLICLPARFQNLHNWDSTAAALLAVYCAVWFLQTGKETLAFLTGLFAGSSLMIDQSKGSGVLLGLVIAMVVLWRSQRELWTVRNLVNGAVGAALPSLLVLTYFTGRGALREMLAAWLWPLYHYTAVNSLPYGYNHMGHALIDSLSTSTTLERAIIVVVFSAMTLVSVFPILIIALATVEGVKQLRRPETRPDPLSQYVIVSGAILLGTFLSTWATGRPDFLRMIYLTPLYLFSLPLVLDAKLVTLPGFQRLRITVACFLLIGFLAAGALMSWPGRIATNVVNTRRGMIRTAAPDEVIPYVQAHVPQGERVLMYPYAVTYSFLTATMSPTRYDFLQVGMHTPEQFREATQELENARTPVVIFDLAFRSIAPQTWPSTRAEDLAHDPMGDFIFQNYRGCRTLRRQIAGAPFLYMVRKDLPCPSDKATEQESGQGLRAH